jgi:hypothetical protein
MEHLIINLQSLHTKLKVCCHYATISKKHYGKHELTLLTANTSFFLLYIFALSANEQAYFEVADITLWRWLPPLSCMVYWYTKIFIVICKQSRQTCQQIYDQMSTIIFQKTNNSMTTKPFLPPNFSWESFLKGGPSFIRYYHWSRY